MPWNFPFWQVFRFAAPGAHGRQRRPAQARLQRAAVRAGHRGHLPPRRISRRAAFRRCSSARPRCAESSKITAWPRSPSPAAPAPARPVASAAGKVVKKTVLELGGSDPFIVMPSADLDAAVRTAVKARTINNGQSCIAAKRFIVAESIADEFERRFVAGFEALRVGDPMDPATDVGPLATEAQARDGRASRSSGRWPPAPRCSPAGSASTGRGTTTRPPCSPTSLPTRPRTTTRCSARWRRSSAPAISTTRSAWPTTSPFGLGASAWTNDAGERSRFVAELEAGMVFINAMVASDPRLAVRRRQAVGLRPRAVARRHQGVRERQGGVDPVTWRTTQKLSDSECPGARLVP